VHVLTSELMQNAQIQVYLVTQLITAIVVIPVVDGFDIVVFEGPATALFGVVAVFDRPMQPAGHGLHNEKSWSGGTRVSLALRDVAVSLARVVGLGLLCVPGQSSPEPLKRF